MAAIILRATEIIKGRWQRLRISRERRRVCRQRRAPADFPADDWPRSLSDPLGFYLDCFCYFHQRLPAEIKEHRRYFCKAKRGFGEDAFHTMWFLLFREFKPRSFLEIGVYRGQTVTLAALLARHFGLNCAIHGISPFSSAGDSVSRYMHVKDYLVDTLRNFDAFGLPPPALLKAYSTDPQARQLIASEEWDLAYIDGNHDYEVARADWDNCAAAAKVGAVIVLDDSGLSSNYYPPIFASRGHPGPSRVADEVPREQFREILQVGHNRVFQKIR